MASYLPHLEHSLLRVNQAVSLPLISAQAASFIYFSLLLHSCLNILVDGPPRSSKNLSSHSLQLLPFLYLFVIGITKLLDNFIIFSLIVYFFIPFSMSTILLPFQLFFSQLHFLMLFLYFTFIYPNLCFLMQ